MHIHMSRTRPAPVDPKGVPLFMSGRSPACTRPDSLRYGALSHRSQGSQCAALLSIVYSFLNLTLLCTLRLQRYLSFFLSTVLQSPSRVWLQGMYSPRARGDRDGCFRVPIFAASTEGR
jgi:hypothetical protein